MLDQNYTSHDPAEKISTLMFNGNTSTMHDAFMACAACNKVKVVELFDGHLYPTLTNTDTFSGKFIIDHASNEQSPAYAATASIVYMAKNGHVSLHGRFTASYIESLGALRANGTLTVVGLSFLTGGMSSPKGTFGGGNTQGGSDVSLDVGKLAKFLHTEFHAPMRLQYNGSQEAPGRTPVVQVTSGPTFDLTVPPFSGYLDGECLRIVNMSGSTLNINGTASTDSIPPYRFGDVFRWNGVWYMER
jgi:hypothetical protein